MIQKFLYNLFIAFEAISSNRLRSFLTSLGIIFGVASVISMLAIGKGAQSEILDQLKLLGTNNIIIKPIVEQEEGKVEENQLKLVEKKRFTPGLNIQDARAIEAYVPHVNFVSPEFVDETLLIHSGLKRSVKLVGVESAYFETTTFELAEGRMFTEYHHEHATPVCIIGHGIAAKFFAKEDPLGRQIKCGKLWMTVIGILKEKKLSEKNIKKLGIRDYNMDVYAPLSTLLLRYKNRALVTESDILKNSRRQEEQDKTAKNYHQIDRLVVQVADTKFMPAISDIVHRLLKRRHNEVIDFEVIIPELLLEQEQRTKSIFNIVLGAIASISLIVGGIGIMNIMLASVMERIREIGVRLAVGATKKDIILQFLFEAIALSLTGGIIGIIIGFLISAAIEKSTGITTIVSVISVAVSFLVALAVGLIFGLFPAKQAAEQDPIVSLRYE